MALRLLYGGSTSWDVMAAAKSDKGILHIAGKEMRGGGRDAVLDSRALHGGGSPGPTGAPHGNGGKGLARREETKAA